MMLSRSTLVLACLIVVLLTLKDVVADVDEPLRSKGWHEIPFDNKQQNLFRTLDGDGIEVISSKSVSLLQKSLAIDISVQPILRWRWCVTKSAPSTDLSIKGSDDRSLAIFVAFPFVEERATAFERIERKMVEATLGKDAPGRILMYVWGGGGDRGALVNSPHLGDIGMMKILRPGTTPPGEWFAEEINIADDYREAFGREAPNPIHIAISADTDDTNSSSKGIVTDLKFVGSLKAFW